jgi:type I restriction enzyme S subunit
MSAALLENFDLLAVSVGGVARLRELILSLAVRGRLVPQDPEDEPASELLKRIRAEKDRLIKEGKIKRDKHLPPRIEDDKPYDLPASWEWVRLGDLLPEFQNGASSRGDEGGTSTVVLRLADIKSGQISLAASRTIPINRGDVGKYRLIGADILIVRVNGSADIVGQFIPVESGVSAIYCDHFIRMRISQDWCRTGYLCLLGKTSLIRDRISRLFITTAGQKTVNQGHIGSLLVALPPLAEQSRIVAKVEELMGLCDRLEAEQGHAARVQRHWVDAALDQLAESADADEFRRHWQHLAAHFDTLFTTPESIDSLDATLLQLAVRGKLVPQDPNDEPASELLKQIRAEKERLIKEGRIKRDKPRPPISDDERPYELPEGWVWVTIPELCQIGGGATPSKNIGRYWDGSIPWVSPKDMKVALIADAIDHVSPAALEETRLPLVPPNSILVVVRGMILAHSFPVGVTQTEVTINQDMKSLTPYAESLSNYLALAMRGFKSDILALVDRSTHGTCKLESEKLFSYRFALPPLAEQSRIVAQVEKLQALTASLKARLTAAQTKQAQLAEALIAEVTTPIGAALLEGENSGPPQPFDPAAFSARMKAEHD